MPNWKTYESSVRLLSAILAAHPELRLNYQEVAKCFGGDCTPSALENRFRRIKMDARSIKDCLARGDDPINLPVEGGRVGDAASALVGGKKISKYYGVDENGEKCTKDALDHRFRPIKTKAREMRAEHGVGGGIADKFGEDVTAKAVSTRFERLKKEPSWLGNDDRDTNGKTANVNGTPKTTPRKKAAKKTTLDGNSASGDDDEDMETKSPLSHKKPLLNKTQGGRVQKPQTPKKKVASQQIVDLDGDDEIFKMETPGDYENQAYLENHGHSFGYNDGDMEMHSHNFYDSQEDIA